VFNHLELYRLPVVCILDYQISVITSRPIETIGNFWPANAQGALRSVGIVLSCRSGRATPGRSVICSGCSRFRAGELLVDVVGSAFVAPQPADRVLSRKDVLA
jgi:hypothetical protein